MDSSPSTKGVLALDFSTTGDSGAHVASAFFNCII
jgi:hypothetical protein